MMVYHQIKGSLYSGFDVVLVEFPGKGTNLEEFHVHPSETRKLSNELFLCVLFR